MVPITLENARQCTLQAQLVKHIAQISNENNKTIHLVNSTSTSIACCYRTFIITAQTYQINILIIQLKQYFPSFALQFPFQKITPVKHIIHELKFVIISQPGI